MFLRTALLSILHYHLVRCRAATRPLIQSPVVETRHFPRDLLIPGVELCRDETMCLDRSFFSDFAANETRKIKPVHRF